MRIVSFSKNLEAVEATAMLLNNPPPPGYTYWFPVAGFGLTSVNSGGREIESFRAFLQKLIEEWLRCGKKIMPAHAEVHAVGMGQGQSVEGYSSRWHWSLSLIPKAEFKGGSRVREKKLDLSDPAYSSWLWKVYWDYLLREKPNVWFNSDGEVLLNYTSPVYGVPEPFVVLPPFLNADSPNLDSWKEAVLWFILLLNSGYAQRLDRCAYCKRYFVRKRDVKSGHVYKRLGANCGNCRVESSKVRTDDIRKAAKENMLDTAAAAWAAWTRSHRTPERHSAVAVQVNRQCRREIFVTTRKHQIESLWVKRNEKEILARVEQIALRKGADRNAKS